MYNIIFNPYNLMFGWLVYLEGQRKSLLKCSKVKLRGKTGMERVLSKGV